MPHYSSGTMSEKSWGNTFSSLSHTTIYIVVQCKQHVLLQDIGDNIVAGIHISDMIRRFRSSFTVIFTIMLQKHKVHQGLFIILQGSSFIRYTDIIYYSGAMGIFCQEHHTFWVSAFKVLEDTVIVTPSFRNKTKC